MLALPGIIALMVFVIVKPMEIFPILQRVPLLYLVFGLTILALTLDLKLRLIRPLFSPLLVWVVLFFVWCFITMAVRGPHDLTERAIEIVILLSLFFLVSHGIQSLRGVRAAAAGLVGLALFLSIVGVHQRMSPLSCVQLDPGSFEFTGTPDGRPCEHRSDCGGGENEYVCEHVGLFGTLSIHNRVRYKGDLRDPNDLALALTVMFPFTMAMIQTRRSRTWIALAAVTGLLCFLCVIFTKSRGGQLAFMITLGFYVYRRLGVPGLVACIAVGVGVYIFASEGRHDLAASADERLQCWYEGMNMFRASPLIGVGHRLFTEHHYLTAHNSFILAAAELGFPGLFLWTGVFYTVIRMLIRSVFRLADVPEARDAFHWATAQLVSLFGLLAGMFFLSFCYHPLTWMIVGLGGAIQQTVRVHDPRIRFRTSLVDLLLVFVLTVAVVVGLMLYTRFNPG